MGNVSLKSPWIFCSKTSTNPGAISSKTWPLHCVVEHPEWGTLDLKWQVWSKAAPPPDRKILLGSKFSISGFLGVRKFWQVFFMVFKTNVSIFHVISLYFNTFWKFLWLENSALDFWGLHFGPGIFWGFVWSPRDCFGFLIFAPIWSSLSLEIRSTPPGGEHDKIMQNDESEKGSCRWVHWKDKHPSFVNYNFFHVNWLNSNLFFRNHINWSHRLTFSIKDQYFY